MSLCLLSVQFVGAFEENDLHFATPVIRSVKSIMSILGLSGKRASMLELKLIPVQGMGPIVNLVGDTNEHLISDYQ